MPRSLFMALVVAVAACGGGDGSGGTFGTLPPTTASTQPLVTVTTLPPPPPDVSELVIVIERMPAGWVQIDDMSGSVGLDAIDASLLEGLGDLGVVKAHRATFARSATSELAALARGGAELIVSLAVEMESADQAATAVDTLVDRLSASTVGSSDIRTPSPGVRLELTGGIFMLLWSDDVIVQAILANGVPGTNIANIADLVPEPGR